MSYKLICGDCLEVMPTLEIGSVDLACIDFPYWGVKDNEWDNQWATRDDFLSWIGSVCDEVKRLLAPNGSFYAFASPQMAWHVEGVIRERFNVLNRIVWAKPEPGSEINHGASNAGRISKDSMRAYYPNTESIIFVEHFNSDNIAKGEAGYIAKCDQLRGFVFEPLRAYLDSERERAGVTTRQIAEEFQKKTGSRTVTGMAGHWFSDVQWTLPTENNYNWLRETLSKLNHNGEYLRREYEDLRREYEDLRREYEDLRRPFNAMPDAPYTDVWTFPTVQTYPGKHPTEKPIALIEHIVKLSSRPNDVIFDCCMGHGTAGIAAGKLGRKFIGIERDAQYFHTAQSRIAAAYGDWDKAITTKRVFVDHSHDLPLFAAAD